jgi:hypothetical protein
MKVAPDQTMTPAQVREVAQRWYDGQRTRLAQCLGPKWPKHQAWVEDYLKAELRERLIALGWRPKNG